MSSEQTIGNALVTVQQATDKHLAAMLAGNSFLPSIRLAAGLSEPVKFKRIQEGMFYLSDQNPQRCLQIGTFKELGPGQFRGEFYCVCGPWRYHALHLKDREVVAESFNPEEPIFKEIQLKAPESTKDNVYMFGVDQLFWVPPSEIEWKSLLDTTALDELKEKYGNGFAAVYFYAKTARQYAPANRVPIGTPMLIGSGAITYKANTWYVPNDRQLLPSTHERFKAYFEGETPEATKQLLIASPQFNNPVVTAPEIVSAVTTPSGAVVETRVR